MRKSDKRFFSLKWFAVSISLVVVVWLIWILFFYGGDCKDWECFNAHLGSCDEVSFVGGKEMIFEYNIQGKSGDSCVVDVKLLQGELNNKDSMKLEGKSMVCDLPFGVVMSPESDISNCHGLLKEGLQDLIIRKLHLYLVQNLGILNLEAADLPNTTSAFG
jgi:hypothetical protein